nr:MAG TPA: hypothetical protein [Caudoviricetes sp.]
MTAATVRFLLLFPFFQARLGSRLTILKEVRNDCILFIFWTLSY